MRIGLLALCILSVTCTKKNAPQLSQKVDVHDALKKQCKEQVGEPRVIEVSPTVFTAVGYDLANVTLIKTSIGNLIIDAGMRPDRARAMRAALLEKSPGPIKALIYTHSHIDHVGGASVWVEADTQIWATDEFKAHFFKQYNYLRPLEQKRAERMYGVHLHDQEFPCAGIGTKPELRNIMTTGARLPTHTFSKTTTLQFGDTEIRLIEAQGETHDSLIAYLPAQNLVAIGDNYYHAFPNLYTIRGSSPRPIDQWIETIDKVRNLDPDFIVPGHTLPLTDKTTIRQNLRDYRDAIAYVYLNTVAMANRGADFSELETIRLPPHLAANPVLAELYGQVDWSAKGIYSSQIGWFDGQASNLYPPDSRKADAAEIEIMGGKMRVFSIAKARREDDLRFSTHLLAKLLRAEPKDNDIKEALAANYRMLAEKTANSNGRAYLLESAYELTEGQDPLVRPQVDEGMLKDVPLRIFMNLLAFRLKPDKDNLGLTETIKMIFTDTKEVFYITQRAGVTEISETDALPGTPEPIAIVSTDSMTFKKVATKSMSRVGAFASGKFKIEGSVIGYGKFMLRYNLE